MTGTWDLLPIGRFHVQLSPNAESLIRHAAHAGIAALGRCSRRYPAPDAPCIDPPRPHRRHRRRGAGWMDLRVLTRSDLGEVRYGSWTGRNVKLLARTNLWKVVHQVPSRARFPGGESLLEVQHRMVRELERIAAAHPKQVVAVCSHADPIRLALAHFAGMHTDLYHRISVDTASVSVLALGDGTPRILKMNDTGDLSVLAPRRSRGRARAKVRG